jgi:2-iminobutanoate/2-iminopropanoate deaminase
VIETIPHNPEGIYQATPDYIHALEVRKPERFLYISGTVGLDKNGVGAKSVEEQVELIWSNIRAILASADMTVDNIVLVTSYLRDEAYVEVNQNARVKALKGRAVPTTAIVVQTLTERWLVEIEAIAAA